MCTSVQAGYSREREGPQCWGQNQLFGCPCSSPEVVEGRSHWFTDIFATRQVTPYSFCYDLTKKIKMQSWGTWGPVWSPLIHKRGRKKAMRGHWRGLRSPQTVFPCPKSAAAPFQLSPPQTSGAHLGLPQTHLHTPSLFAGRQAVWVTSRLKIQGTNPGENKDPLALDFSTGLIDPRRWQHSPFQLILPWCTSCQHSPTPQAWLDSPS